MSTAATPALAPELESYARAWAKSLAAARQSLSAATCEMSAQAPANAPAAAEGDIWISATSSGKSGGVVAFRFNRAGARRLVQTAANKKPEASEEISADHKAALLDWMRRAALALPANLPSQRDIQFQVDLADGPLANPGATFWFLIQAGDADPTVLEARMDSQSVLGLQPMISARIPPIPSDTELSASKLGMLMDVELVVTVRFGGRRMLLKDILDLCAGSVVELDQQVQEPVDLLLDGKLIARGEVVVVDGNYGLRVTEVLTNAGN